MTPAARHQAAIEVLEAWAHSGSGEALDRTLAAWGRAHRFAGSGDRHAIADICYGTVRRARSLQWLGGGGDPGSRLEAFRPRIAVLAGAVFAGQELSQIAGAGRYAPAALTAEEADALAALAAEGEVKGLEDVPPGVRFNLPDWLLDALGSVPGAALAALGERAPVDLRVNRLKATPEAAAAALVEESIETERGPLAPDCLRVVGGARRVAGSAAYRGGLVELQDAASQAAALRARAAPGEIVLDLCAGGGGKTLALAAAMEGPAPGRGRLIAHDASPRRMSDLAPRAARAGARVETIGTEALAALEGACDLVLTDVPCSGSGAWRRDGDARWRFGRQDLERLNATQDAILDRAARLVRPGGRLVYVTCSIILAENAARVEAFLARTSSFRPDPAGAFSTFPDPAGGDGFFVFPLLNQS
ncbi:MAG: RsmB/NOP family class I SAM-dependent RNA methyltransferase [Pseudomonadota bacterium]